MLRPTRLKSVANGILNMLAPNTILFIQAADPHSVSHRETRGFRDIIDTRFALTLRHHGVTRFATANVKHFQGFGSTEVWNPLLK